MIFTIISFSGVMNAGSTKYAPIIMGDTTTFIPYGQTNELNTIKDVYKPNDIVSVKVNAALSGDEDWVGVYPKTAVSNWENVIAWNWIPNNGTFALSEVKKTMPVGAYEARLFFHNNFEVKASYPFVVSTDTFKTIKTQYAPNEEVSVMVNVPLSGEKDWVAIFKKGDISEWKNVIAWNWVGQGNTVLNKNQKPMPAGEYEIRLFFNNTYDVEVSYSFTVTNSDNLIYPPNTQYTNIPTNNNVAKPEKGASVIDPEFGSTITRVTDFEADSCNFGYPHPKTQSWNADMSLLRVIFRLYDANTLEESSITKGLNCDDAYKKLGALSSTLRWSHKDPNVYYVLGNLANNTPRFVFRKHTINGNTITHEVIKDFSEYGFELMEIGSNEGSMDHNDRRVVFTAKKPNDDHVWGVLLDTGTNPVSVKVKQIPNSSWGTITVHGGTYSVYDWLLITPKGDRILELKTVNGTQLIGGGPYNYYPDREVYMYDLNFENPVKISNHGGHGDIGIDSNGHQVFVQFEYGQRSGTWSYNLDTLDDALVGTKLLSSKGGHISCQNYNRPGWCYLSTTIEGTREVYALKLDGSGIVNRFAQTRYQYSSLGGVSPDGKRVVFASDWNVNGEKDIYQAVLKSDH
jgi:hypothetical protein